MKINIPDKLYGRSSELNFLLDAYERIKTGTLEMIFVEGKTGTGKSALVMAFEHIIESEQYGYLVSGACDLMQRNIPYYSIISAFEESIDDLLTNESDESIAQRKAIILDAVGDLGKVLTDLIPKLELLIGKQPDIPVIGGQEAQNRFNYVFQRFIHAISTKESPLILFLDDLQWIDTASLKLLELLLEDSSNHYLLFMGAYRGNEIDENHALTATLKHIKAYCQTTNNQRTTLHLAVKPFSFQVTHKWICDILDMPKREVAPFASLIHKKTMGNAFFVKQFLTTLYSEKILFYDDETQKWNWQLEAIEGLNITDNVVELMVIEFNKLPQTTKNLLQIASIIGTEFEIKDLYDFVINFEKTSTSTDILKIDLKHAIVAGLLIKDKKVYKFAHDQIRQTIYNTISTKRNIALNANFGTYLYEKERHSFGTIDITSNTTIPEIIFKITNHWNIGQTQLISAPVKFQLAQFNLYAATKAKQQNAFQEALIFVEKGINLLPKDSWKTHYKLTLAAHNHQIEAFYLTGAYAEVFPLFEMISKNSKTVLDTVKAYEILIQTYTAQNRLQDAVLIGQDILKELGLKLTKKSKRFSLLWEFTKTRILLSGKTPEQLINQPKLESPKYIAIMRIIKSVLSAIYFSRNDLLPTLIIKSLQITLNHGNSPTSAIAYGGYGYILANAFQQYEKGYAYSEMSLQMIEKFEDAEVKVMSNLIHYSFLHHWRHNLKDCIRPLVKGYQISRESGEMEYAAYFSLIYNYHAFFTGSHLSLLSESLEAYISQVKQFNQPVTLQRLQLQLQVIDNFKHYKDEPQNLSGPIYDEDDYLPNQIKEEIDSALASYFISKMILCYYYEDYRAALKNALGARPYLATLEGTLLLSLFYFFDGLIKLAACQQITYYKEDEIAKKELLSNISENHQFLKTWADNAPINYLHKKLLFEAELKRYEGDTEAAISLFNQAIIEAENAQFTQETALSYEMAGRFYTEMAELKMAKEYFETAYQTYQNWGAKGKASHLKIKYLS